MRQILFLLMDDEYEDHELDNSENEDDGIVLDIMGWEYTIRRKDF